jgi:hypothetical protein
LGITLEASKLESITLKERKLEVVLILEKQLQLGVDESEGQSFKVLYLYC